ncbi:MAG: hypothetical protein K1X88_02140 [Nannocystaceae bacterium]|nr:hypothetical protein [Nannocystaceae bacterium]
MRATTVISLLLLACGSPGPRGTTTFGSALSVGEAGSATTQAEASSSSSVGDGGSATSSSGDGEASGSSGGTASADSGASTTTLGGSSSGGAAVECPAPGGEDCSPGPGTGEGDQCTAPGSCFLDIVQGAVNGVIGGHPEWFDQSSGQPYVLDVEAYMNQVVADVAAVGLCAIRDPNAGDEMVVKHDNDFAENFDILTADGFARYGEGIYTSTCAPAWF